MFPVYEVTYGPHRGKVVRIIAKPGIPAIRVVQDVVSGETWYESYGALLRLEGKSLTEKPPRTRVGERRNGTRESQ
jgi:hypothetical protein